MPSEFLRVPKHLFVYYMGNWVPRFEITNSTSSLSGRGELAKRRRRWHARGRTKY